jgi:hypothetical protein
VSISQSVEEIIDSFGSQTFILHYFTVFVDVPVYTQVRSSLMRLNLDSQTGKEPLGIDVIIGIVIGVCATIALFAGMFVFMIHWRSNKNGSGGSSSSAQRDRANVLVTPEMVNASPEERPSDGHLDDEEAIESLSNFSMKDIEDQPPIWI